MRILLRRLESLNEAVRIKDREILKLQTLNATLEDEKKQYLQMKVIQEQTIQKVLNKANTLNQEYLKEIQELKDVSRLVD